MTLPKPHKASVKVIGGFPVKDSEWPATLKLQRWASQKPKGKSALCTATVVGRHTVMTAAHCLTKKICVGKLKLPSMQGELRLRCEKLATQDNSRQIPIDLSLCRSVERTKPIRLKGGARFEKLYAGTAESLIGKKLKILGVGCIARYRQGNKEARLFYGPVKVLRLKRGDLFSNSAADSTSKTMALCSGDSGGGAYFNISAKRRRIVGVNKKGNGSTRSLILSTNREPVREAIRNWASSKHGGKICGLKGELGEDEYYCKE